MTEHHENRVYSRSLSLEQDLFPIPCANSTLINEKVTRDKPGSVFLSCQHNNASQLNATLSEPRKYEISRARGTTRSGGEEKKNAQRARLLLRSAKVTGRTDLSTQVHVEDYEDW